LLYVA